MKGGGIRGGVRGWRGVGNKESLKLTNSAEKCFGLNVEGGPRNFSALLKWKVERQSIRHQWRARCKPQRVFKWMELHWCQNRLLESEVPLGDRTECNEK